MRNKLAGPPRSGGVIKSLKGGGQKWALKRVPKKISLIAPKRHKGGSKKGSKGGLRGSKGSLKKGCKRTKGDYNKAKGF